MQLSEVGNNLWTYEGETVSFFGLPYSTRMAVIRINQNELWIHSPEKLNPQLQEELAQLGEVKYLISPNKLHHLYLSEWSAAYPGTASYAAPGLIKNARISTSPLSSLTHRNPPGRMLSSSSSSKAARSWRRQYSSTRTHAP
jgi:hypothetical protein